MKVTKIKSGFIAIVGRPNVGKSSILNKLLDRKIAITSDKSETTRHRILGVLTKEDYQIVFVDTPGMANHNKNLLSTKVTKVAKASLDDSDLVYLVVDKEFDKKTQFVLDDLKKSDSNVFLVINKTDLLKTKKDIDKIILSYLGKYDFKEYVPVSAKTGKNLDKLIELSLKYLPEGGLLFEEDYLSNQSEIQLISELIREKVLHYTMQEIPHSVAVKVGKIEFNEEQNTYDVFADIIVEKASQKQILIGKNGQKIKQIGTQARLDINKELDTKVHLDLWVRVKKDWRNDERILSHLNIGEDVWSELFTKFRLIKKVTDYYSFIQTKENIR